MTKKEDRRLVVCVTGASGFIASHIVHELLQDDRFIVHGTVRSLAMRDKYCHLLSLPSSSERLHLFEADLLKEASFDEALLNVDYLIHTACPFYLTPFTADCEGAQEKLVNPSLKGTLNVLRSVERVCLNTLKRIVYTGSTGSLVAFQDREFGRVYTEEDWNEKSTIDHNAFAYSKTITERAIWDWHRNVSERYGSEMQLDICTILPSLVIGPILNYYRIRTYGINDMSQSLKLYWTNIQKKKLDPEKGHTIGTNGFSIVDVRDVARLHRIVLDHPKASQQRYVAFSGKAQWIKVNRLLKDHFPQFSASIPLEVVSDLSEDVAFWRMICFSSEKVLHEIPELGEFREVNTCLIDMIQSMLDHNLLEISA